MANTLFDPGREGVLDRTIDVTGATIKVGLVRGYTFSGSHKFVSDLTGAGGTVVAGVALTSKTYTAGVFNAANAVLAAVTTGAACAALIVYNDTGTDTTSRLVAYIDSAGGTLPVTPNGGDVDVNWDTGANKIFKL